MAAGTQVVMTDVQGLTDGFLKSKYGAGRKVQKLLESKADELVKEMQAVVPVRSGRLKNSIRKNSQAGRIVVGPVDVEYAAYVEYGTNRMKAQPYVRPSLDKILKTLGPEAAVIGAQIWDENS
jgi:HK97 gp10 family phage protein